MTKSNMASKPHIRSTYTAYMLLSIECSFSIPTSVSQNTRMVKYPSFLSLRFIVEAPIGQISFLSFIYIYFE